LLQKRKDNFLLAEATPDTVLACKTVKKAFVTFMFVARAIAGDLVEGGSHLGSQSVGHEGCMVLFELQSVQCVGQRLGRWIVVVDKFAKLFQFFTMVS
jgi:hypothetical protein